MLTKLLFKFYFIAPRRFKGFLLNQISRKEGGQMYSSSLRLIMKKQYGIEIGYGSYGGCFSPKSVPPGVSFGNYCSIAPEIRIFRANHPKDTFTSHPLLYNPTAGYVKKDMLDRPKLSIGHDVWIGEWAVILPSVNKIGNGAMIGAGSIVTKDVEPYTIVAGNPSKVIGRRFNDTQIEELEKTSWWNLKKDELILKVDEFNKIITKNTIDR
jgi:virginiamycin A acetyltransferase